MKATIAGEAKPTEGAADGYTYVWVSEELPETVNVWHNGKMILSEGAANTGIPGAETELGTFNVYERFEETTMSGENPDGSHYSDPGIKWVSYFNGGDALHAFDRASYGSPQSLGCVEMPHEEAEASLALHADRHPGHRQPGLSAGLSAARRPQGAVKRSIVPLPECSLASPSGSITCPSTTIGLFQWPGAPGSFAIGLRRARLVDLDPAGVRFVDVEEAAGDDRAGPRRGVLPELVELAAAQRVGGGGGEVGDEDGRLLAVVPDRGGGEELGVARRFQRLHFAAEPLLAAGRAGRRGAARSSTRITPSLPATSTRSSPSRAGALEPRSRSFAFSSAWLRGV